MASTHGVTQLTVQVWQYRRTIRLASWLLWMCWRFPIPFPVLLATGNAFFRAMDRIPFRVTALPWHCSWCTPEPPSPDATSGICHHHKREMMASMRQGRD